MSSGQLFFTLKVAEGFNTPRNSFPPVGALLPSLTVPHPSSRVSPTPQFSKTVLLMAQFPELFQSTPIPDAFPWTILE